ncbi:6-phosphogluconate dehydrogenase C-terminal domain-like protein [Trametes polyzona]|nr:6-phosphogluconate dehydrogenase C-terminal domain-like protein [Trametes polyzona]
MSSGQLKDVLLIGYGAVGAIYSFVLKRSARARVTVVARSNYEAANARGIDIKSRKYGEHQGWRPDRLFPNIEQALDRPYDYVMLVNKAIPELQRTPALLRPLLSAPYATTHPQPTYVLFQNGLNVEIDLYEALRTLRPDEPPRIISSAVWIGTVATGKTEVEHGEFDRVSLGIYRPSTTDTTTTPGQAAALKDFAEILKAGGSEVTVVPEIQRIKFGKNLWNGVFGASAALSRASLRAIFRPPHREPGASGEPAQGEGEKGEGEDAREVRDVQGSASVRATRHIPHAAPVLGAYTIPFLYDALQEVDALGRVLFPPVHAEGSGEVVVPGLEEDIVRKTMERTAALHSVPESTHLPSMLVDALAERPMEVEHVVGEVVRMARKAGVSVPRMEALYALLLVNQNQFLRKLREGKKPE